MDSSSLSYTRWKCQYHIVFIPKYRRKDMYGNIKEDGRQLNKTDLLIIDELSYLTFNRHQSELLFKVIAGRENGETDSETVIREVQEETAYQIALVKERIGTVLQHNRDIYEKDRYFCMTSVNYICTVANIEKTEQSLDKYEEEQEFTAEFVTLDDAIDNNEQLLKSKSINPWVERETYVLKEIQKKITQVYFVRHAQPLHEQLCVTYPSYKNYFNDSSR